MNTDKVYSGDIIHYYKTYDVNDQVVLKKRIEQLGVLLYKKANGKYCDLEHRNTSYFCSSDRRWETEFEIFAINAIRVTGLIGKDPKDYLPYFSLVDHDSLVPFREMSNDIPLRMKRKNVINKYYEVE